MAALEEARTWEGSEDGVVDDMDEDDVAGEDMPTPTSQDLLPRDQHRKTAYYDYVSEKSLSHADAKLFYQRHQIEQQRPKTDQQPLKRPWYAGTHDRYPSTSHDSRRAADHDNHRSTTPVGLADSSNKPIDVAKAQSPDVGGFDPHDRLHAQRQEPLVVAADQPARGRALHPHEPHEPRARMLEEQGVHGAGAGVGIGGGAGGYANNDATVTAELTAIYTNVQRILDMRHKYIRLSLQASGDNPKDDPSWNIYPPPPEPVWDDENNQPIDLQSSNSRHSARTTVFTDPSQQSQRMEGLADQDAGSPVEAIPSSPIRKRRKPGQDIGEDFDMEDLLPLPEESEMTFRLDENSVYQVYETSQSAEFGTPILAVPTIRDFYMDLDAILSISSDGPTKSFAFRRLQYLAGKYNLYFLLNEYQEMAESKRVPHRDFYNVRKVDTHVHHSSCMNQKHLLRFIKSKMKKSPDEVVMYRDGKHLTLREVFQSINLTAYDLSIDTLDMHAHTDSFHRFDKFNLKYNPIGESRLRTIFLKTDNHIQGRYLAELTKEVICDLESSKYQMVEWRISVYGRTLDEWDKLAAWVVDNKLFSHNVRWLIQIPRLYDIYKSSGNMDNFEQVIINVFQPLFEVTKTPSSHPKLHVFLQRVIGFDSVDDESKPERRFFRKFPLPRLWHTQQNPPYSYWIYYLFANMTALNAWRKQRGFNTFLLRPHCGEAGETDHLAAAVLCCHSISHGILLRKVPLLQYIFYLEQIGIAMSPLSNNALFLAYERNPFLQYFRRGLNVSLSTDDPLQIAFTKEPLIEEYSVAAQIYKLNAVDMCELAKHSVLQSGFEYSMKQRWLGNKCTLPGVAGNNVAKSNVPNTREAFRHETLLEEFAMIDRYTAAANPGNPVSTANLPPPAHTDDSQAPPSTSMSMRTNLSALNLYSQDHRLPPCSHLPTSAVTQGSNFPAQAARFPPPYSIRDFKSHETRSRSGGRHLTRSSTIVTPPGEGMSEPRIFPGVVHERARRTSLLLGNSSEKDSGKAGALVAGLADGSLQESPLEMEEYGQEEGSD